MEVCPNCGSYVVALSDDTGWCASCTADHTGAPTTCRICNRVSANGLCSRCKELKWLTRYADEVERIMAIHGIKASKARRFVRISNRPICNSCHEPIKGGAQGVDLFCTKTTACIKAGNAYKYHKNVKRRSHEESLHRAMTISISVQLVSSRGIKWQ